MIVRSAGEVSPDEKVSKTKGRTIQKIGGAHAIKGFVDDRPLAIDPITQPALTIKKISDTAQELLGRGCNPIRVPVYGGAGGGHRRTLQKLTKQGCLGIIYPKEEGGSGLGLLDLIVLMQEMGRAVHAAIVVIVLAVR